MASGWDVSAVFIMVPSKVFVIVIVIVVVVVLVVVVVVVVDIL